LPVGRDSRPFPSYEWLSGLLRGFERIVNSEEDACFELPGWQELTPELAYRGFVPEKESGRQFESVSPWIDLRRPASFG
jgi:hypothetical protein